MMADEEREDVDAEATISDDALPEAEDELDEEGDEDSDTPGFDEFGNPIEE